MVSESTLLFALLGGILPALLWLWFWLKQDKKRPEPRGFIMLAFFAGMIAVPLAVPLEQMVLAFTAKVSFLTFFLWSAIEELLKFGLALIIILRRKVVDEPIDTIIYMITVAIGFAALENTLFLLNPDISIFDGVVTGNLRFIGATLLHILASSTIGAAMAFTFYKRDIVKKMFLGVSIVLAITLHTLFNFFIINSNGEKILTVFIFVWVGIILLLVLFEKVKRITRLNIKQ